MHIEVKTKDEDGNIIFEGQLNRNEVGFLLQFAINQLLIDGVEFNLDAEDDEDNPPMRLKFPPPEGTIN